MVVSDLKSIGKKFVFKINQVSHGRELSHAIVHTKMDAPTLLTLPARYGYLLHGREGAPWEKMSEAWQEKRFSDILMIPWDMAETLRKLVLTGAKETKVTLDQVKVIGQKEIPSLEQFTQAQTDKYQKWGEALIRSGTFARVTIAGGEAARFRKQGDPLAKALIPLTDQGPLSQETYFSVQARDLLLAQYRFNTAIPWLLYIHPAHRELFQKYLEANNYFRLDPNQIILAENTAYVPKFTPDGRIALLDDMQDSDQKGDEIAFYTSGHGSFAAAFRENPIFIEGKEHRHSAYNELAKGRGIKYLFQSNIDNLGASVSTREYSIILGIYYEKESSKDGYKMLIELTTPLIGTHPDGSRFFWDEGGVALRINGQPTIVDVNPQSAETEVINLTQNLDKPFPFNTANATYGIESIPEGITLPILTQNRNGLTQLDRNFWTIAGFIKTAFIQVPRNIPESLAELPPKKDGMSISQLSLPQPFTGPGPKSRFIPTKQKAHQRHAAELYRYTVKSVEEEIHARIKLKSRILIVEDDEVEIGTLKAQLEKDGWDWHCFEIAKNKEQAQAALSLNKYDFIVLDSILTKKDRGETSDGVALLIDLKDEKKENPALNFPTPVLFWSSHKSISATSGMTMDLEDTNELIRLRIIKLVKKAEATVKLSNLIVEEILKGPVRTEK
jgi:CheY-like chemotaxis protein